MAFKVISREEFNQILSYVHFDRLSFSSYLYQAYVSCMESISSTAEQGYIPKDIFINNLDVTKYLLGEFTYICSNLDDEQVKEKCEKTNFISRLATVVTDKYLSLTIFVYSEPKFVNKYQPPESTLYLYLNFLLITLGNKDHNNPKETLFSDLLIKSVSIARCILNLINYGYESTAFASWRTLHECECTLLILAKYGDTAIQAYLRHMNYGLVFKNGAGSKEATDKVFEEIKANMRAHDLKSKDMKKYIEYGWLYSIPDFSNNPNYKLNFRDGMEPLINLTNYKNSYMNSSELIHCTPMLIYSNKQYYYYVCLISLYESFLRLEQVFSKFIDDYIPKEAQDQYYAMRKIYFNQLKSIHDIEVDKFKKVFNKPSPNEAIDNSNEQ